MPYPETRTEPLPTPGRSPLEGRTYCPRDGMPADDSHAVALHDLWHRAQDLEERRQKRLLDRLEKFLDSVENLHTEDGKPQKFAAWKAEVDEILDALPTPEELDRLAGVPDIITEQVREQLAALAPAESTLEHAAPEVIPWPGNPYPDEDVPDEDETVEPDDRDADEIIPSSATHSFPGDPVSRPAAEFHDDEDDAVDWARR